MKWPMVKLGEILCHIGSGATPKGGSKHYHEREEVMFLRSQNVLMNKLMLDDVVYVDKGIDEQLKRSRVYSGDVLLNITGASIGRVVTFDLDAQANVNQHVCILRPITSSLFGKYLEYFLSGVGFQRDLLSLHKGGTREALTFAQIREIEIPLPSLEEQKRIAAILDKADGIRRKRQQAIDLADEFLRSVFLDMFGDPVTNPKGWEVKPVGDICGCIVPGRDKPKSFTGTIPWITTNELIHLGVTIKKDQFIGLSEEEISQVKAKVVPQGAVLMTCVGDLGVVSIAGDDMVINQQLHAFLPSEYVTPSFLSYALAWQKGYMVRMASSTTVPYMNKTICNSVPVIIPPRHLQESFDELVVSINSTVSKQQSMNDVHLFVSLSKQAFSGELLKVEF